MSAVYIMNWYNLVFWFMGQYQNVSLSSSNIWTINVIYNEMFIPVFCSVHYSETFCFKLHREPPLSRKHSAMTQKSLTKAVAASWVQLLLASSSAVCGKVLLPPAHGHGFSLGTARLIHKTTKALYKFVPICKYICLYAIAVFVISLIYRPPFNNLARAST